MEEVIRLLEWARENNISPWAVVWVVAGYLVLRLLEKLGRAVSKTASGLFAHYSSTIKSLEQQAEASKLEAAAAKAQLVDTARELVQAQALIELLRERVNEVRGSRHE